MARFSLLRFIPVLFLVASMAGCSVLSANMFERQAAYTNAMQEAGDQYKDDNYEAAIQLYKKAAELNPVRSEPWYQLALIRFDQKEYGRAIVNSKEALRRNPNQSGALSVRTVSGLREATHSLSLMHDKADINGSARQEATQLASRMRDLLGEKVLVPLAQSDNAHQSPSRVTRPRKVVRRVRHVRKKVKQVKAVEPAPKKSTGSSNPFSYLPGG